MVSPSTGSGQARRTMPPFDRLRVTLPCHGEPFDRLRTSSSNHDLALFPHFPPIIVRREASGVRGKGLNPKS